MSTPETVDDGAQAGARDVVVLQRLENGAIAAMIVVALVALDLPAWWLAASFLLFDLSMVGYARSPRLGAVTYNVVHNYTGPAAALAVHFLAGDTRPDWLVVLAACWAFHVAVDRALGFGLKLHGFGHTHLGSLQAAQKAQPQHSGSRADDMLDD